MSERLPERIDPLLLVRAEQRLQGALPIAEFGRLNDLLFDREGMVFFDLWFRKEGRVDAIVGHVQAHLTLQCQTCLQAVRWDVDRVVNLGIAGSLDEASLLPPAYEPLLVETQHTALRDIVEDELILDLPLIARHSACKTTVTLHQESLPKERPFAVLSKLRTFGGQ